MEACVILRDRGLLNDTQVDTIVQTGVKGNEQIASAISLGFVEEREALQAVAEAVGVDFVDLRETEVDLGLLDEFPTRLIYRESLFPVAAQNGHITVATSDPFNLYPLDEASAATGKAILPVVATQRDIDTLIKNHLGVGSETIDSLVAVCADRRSRVARGTGDRWFRAVRNGPGSIGYSTRKRNPSGSD